MRRNDILSVSIGPANIQAVKAAASERGMPVSALVRSWISTLSEAENGASDNGK